MGEIRYNLESNASTLKYTAEQPEIDDFGTGAVSMIENTRFR